MTRPPMSEARRQHVHGPLMPMIRDTDPVSLGAIAWMVFVTVGVIVLSIWVSQAPAAQTSPDTPARAAETRTGNGGARL